MPDDMGPKLPLESPNTPIRAAAAARSICWRIWMHRSCAHVYGVIVGFAGVLPRPDGSAELDALFVDQPRSEANS
jgi:hypothetical protein